MTYLSGKAARQKMYIRYALGIAFIVLLTLFFTTFKKHFYSFAEPTVVFVAEVKNSIVSFPSFVGVYFTSRKTFTEREKVLQETVEKLENELAEKDFLLRELSGNKEEVSDAQVVNQISMYPLMQDITRIYSTVLLSKGFSHGLEVGDMVYVRGRQAVCTIKEVYNKTSLCLLLTSSDVTTEGVTASSSITLSLVGRGGYYLANIVRDTPVSVGEVVYLRSDPSFVLGVVRQVFNNDQDTAWRVFVEGAHSPVTSSVFYAQPK